MRMFYALLVILFNISAIQNTYSKNLSVLTSDQRCSASGIDHKNVMEFVRKIQKSLKNKNKVALANLVSYPLKVYKSKVIGVDIVKLDKRSNLTLPKIRYSTMTIRTKKEFLRKYSEIFSPNLINNIANADASNVFCNWHGGMIASGQIWFSGKPLRYFEINQPTVDK